MTKKSIPDEELPAYMRPVYEAKATAKDLEQFHVCANCDQVRVDHMPDGKCFFEATSFAVKKVYRAPKDFHLPKGSKDGDAK